MKNRILRMLYPEKCVVCHRVLKDSRNGKLCDVCRPRILPVEEPRCKRCSKALADSREELCGDCRGKSFYVERGFALYPYDEQMQRAVRNLKNGGELAGAAFFAEQMAERYEKWVRGLSPDVLIPVPVHKRRLQFRGFNQAACLAVGIGAALQVSVDEHYLIRTENTKPQKSLDSRERFQNLQKGFTVRGEDGIRYESVLLIDDIYTTGATLEACGKALKEAGTKRIYFLCLCIGRGD